jgi:hypothetical protein
MVNQVAVARRSGATLVAFALVAAVLIMFGGRVADGQKR